MPTYEYVCARNAKHRMDQVRTIADRDALQPCPVCEIGYLVRDVIGSMATNTTEQEYHTPILSDALGVHPSQINEAKSHFPHHEFTPEGQLILRSHAHRNRVMKELGFHDNDGYN